MKNIIGFTKNQLIEELVKLGEKPFRATQIWKWIYVNGAQDFSQMTNIAKETREILAKNFILSRPATSMDKTANDGTRKWLIKYDDGNEVEMVFIPEENRGTLCISSQVGCTLSCKFCHTGTQTLVRNLKATEIISQIMVAKDLLQDWKSPARLTNVVFMGMGEPFYNYDNIAKGVSVLTDTDGLALSRRRVTISTSGLVPEILRMSKEIKTSLAISLHATDDQTRSSIMAINKKYPLDELMKACKIYNNDNPKDKITFEYVLLKNINDRDKDALGLVSLIKKYNLNAKINLIPFNPWTPCGFERSDDEAIIHFQKILKKHNLVAPIRRTRGNDVMAACGQLKSDSQRQKKSQR